MGCVEFNGGHEDIKKVSDHVKGFYPKCGRKSGLKEEGADNVVNGT